MSAETARAFYPLEVEEPDHLPGPDFDPFAATAEQLEHYWLPPRPDPRLAPELYEHWSDMMSPLPVFVRSQSTPPIGFLGSPTAPFMGFRSSRRSRIQGSRNWSGAYMNALEGNRFTRVVGRWTVPAIKAGVRAAGETPLGKVPFKCSAWIGLDGKRGWMDLMPQCGSVHELKSDDTTQVHELWWQWWERGNGELDGLPWTVKGVPISPGHVVLGSLIVSGPKHVRVHLMNRTTGLFATVQLKKAAVLGATAQWIVERPADWRLREFVADPGPLNPLPDYGSVIFDHCAYEHASGATGTPPVVQPFAPRFIRLKQRFPQFDSVAVISAPETHDYPPGGLKVNYRRPA